MDTFAQHQLTFVHGAWLLAALPSLALLVSPLFRKKKNTLPKSPHKSPAFGLPVTKRPQWRINLSCTLLALALARPYLGETTISVKTTTKSRQVLIALDVSRSMLVNDVKPSRLERAKMLIRSLLDPLAGEQVGLILFAGTAFLQCPMSTDHDVLRETLPLVNPDFIPKGGTNYDRMLETALSSFPQDANATPILIIMSDGEAHDQSWRRHLREISKRGITLITLGIGTQDGGVVPSHRGGFEKHQDGRPVFSRLEPRTLQELANISGGIYLDASHWLDLGQVVTQVTSHRAATIFKDKNITQKNELFYWPLLGSAFLVLWALLTEVPVHPLRRKLSPGTKIVGSFGKMNLAQLIRVSKNKALVLILLAPLFLPLEKTTANEISPGSPAPPMSANNNSNDEKKTSLDATRAKLLESVKELIKTPSKKTAQNYACFATNTLGYLESAAAKLTQETIRALAIDGLEAVQHGSILAPDAANWKDLRQKLQRWLEINPKQQHQPTQPWENQPKNHPQNYTNKTQQKNPDDNNQNQNTNSDTHNSEQSPQTLDQQNHQQSKSSTGTSDCEKKSNSHQSQNHSNYNDHTLTSGPYGDRPLKDDTTSSLQNQNNNKPDQAQPLPTYTPSSQPGQRTQKQTIGGQKIKNTQEPLDTLPEELREAITLLDQARQNDRPAVLFERMMQNQKTQPDEGKNW